MDEEPNVTYESVEPLLDDIEIKNDRARVQFRCTRTDHTASAHVPVDRGSDLSEMVKTGLFMVLISTIRAWIYRRLGLRSGRRRRGGFGRRRRRRRRKSTANSVRDHLPLTGKTRERTVINAFKKVQNQFMWNDELQLWVHPEYARQQM